MAPSTKKATKVSDKSRTTEYSRSRLANSDHPTIYSNFIGVGATQFDISIIFAEVTGTEGPEIVATPRAKITMAPEQAANLLRMLSATLKQYIEHNGPLRSLGEVGPAALEEAER